MHRMIWQIVKLISKVRIRYMGWKDITPLYIYYTICTNIIHWSSNGAIDTSWVFELEVLCIYLFKPHTVFSLHVAWGGWRLYEVWDPRSLVRTNVQELKRYYELYHKVENKNMKEAEKLQLSLGKVPTNSAESIVATN